MSLSHERDKLLELEPEDLLVAIKDRRQALRWHRDQRGDDRCWLDDFLLYQFVVGLPVTPRVDSFLGMNMCVFFYEFCRVDELDPIPPEAILDPARWDHDLNELYYDGNLLDELEKVQKAIFNLASITDRPRTVQDYRELYSILPEKIPADFRLPPREKFLQKTSEQSGCPNFWLSHVGCSDLCNLHQWGPCR